MDNLIFVSKPLINFIKNEVEHKYYSKNNPGRKLHHKLDNIIEGILFMCKTGTQIAFVNYKCIPGSALMYHFYKWTADNIFYNCWTKVYKKYQASCKYNTNLNNLVTDCSLIKSMNGNDCIGRNPTDRGRNGTKLSIITDLIGVPVGYYLSGANKKDHKLLEKTFRNKIYTRKCKSNMYSDKGYSNSQSIQVAKKNNCKLFAPNKENFVKKMFIDTIKLVKTRYIVESFFSWLKSYRRIILRYDRLVKNYSSHLFIAFSIITCKKIHNHSTRG